MVLRIVLSLALTAVAFAIAGRRLWWLKRLALSVRSAPERVAAVRAHPSRDAGVEATEVIGQRKLLKWTVPGAAHVDRQSGTAAEVAHRLRWTRRERRFDELDLFNRGLAVSETLAHLDVLVVAGRLRRADTDGISHYAKA